MEFSKVNYVLIPLSVLNDIAKSGLPKNYDLQSLKTILTGGSKVSKDILLKAQRESPNAFVGQAYGNNLHNVYTFKITRYHMIHYNVQFHNIQ